MQGTSGRVGRAKRQQKGGDGMAAIDQKLIVVRDGYETVLRGFLDRMADERCFPIMKAIWKSSGQRDAGM